jgi:MinD superfamily P-loop ATPase
MNELVVISGKGGTGKTSLTASLAVLADRPVLADCDVDAADLHLILTPQVRERHPFGGSREAVVRSELCGACGLCLQVCRFGAIATDPSGGPRPIPRVDPFACEGCGVCVRFCPRGAIEFRERLCGEWMISHTRCGPMVHARLGIAAENSGKLVSTVRQEAKRIAEEEGREIVLVDGPPGIGCPVIASVTGADLVLVVTEPTVAGEHDLGRVLALTRHFGIPSAVCVNKWDINAEMTDRIEEEARGSGARLAGRIRYDRAVTSAQMRGRAVSETEAPCAADVRAVWNSLNLFLGEGRTRHES